MSWALRKPPQLATDARLFPVPAEYAALAGWRWSRGSVEASRRKGMTGWERLRIGLTGPLSR